MCRVGYFFSLQATLFFEVSTERSTRNLLSVLSHVVRKLSLR